MGRHDVTGQGQQIFAGVLERFAAEVADPRLTAVAHRIAAPLRVGVRGRRGVGRRTVARALNCVGVPVTVDDEDAEVVVHVVAEALKPEDRDVLAVDRRPTVIALNKADLAGFGGGGPIAAAQARCARLRALTGVPAEPLVGLLAVAAVDDHLLDDTVLAALRLLATEPADLGSTDGFVDGAHRLSRSTRQRLLDTLDLFGIAHGVLAVRRCGPGADPASVAALLRRVSRVDVVAAAIADVGAEVGYRRVLDAVGELEALAATDDRLAGAIANFLADDDTVVARMAAAVDVVEAVGITVDPADHPAAHLGRAIRWQRYSGGPVSGVHHACGADIARGSLRLWAQAGGSR